MSAEQRSGDDASSLGWYMGGQASWFLSFGLQMIMFPILVANVLEETGTRVGIAQMSLSAPAIAFMLLGGATADRGDPRSILFRVHLFAALPPLALATALNSDFLSFEILVCYGLFMGTATAFAMPARDASLSVVGGTDIQRTVTLALAVQQIAQLGGMVIALFAATLGASLLFTFQGLMMLAGGVASRQLPKRQQQAGIAHAPRLRAMRDGLAYVRHSEILLPVVIAMFAIGVFYIGSFLVVLPLIVRDFYQGGYLELGLANIAFFGGMIISTVFLLRIGHVVRRGRAVIISLFAGVVVVTAFTFQIPYWLFCTLSLTWGLGAGYVMTLARTIVQTEADAAFRARALSIFQLGFAGGSPVGSLIMGILSDKVGTHAVMWFPAIGMTLVLSWLMVKSRLWTLAAHAE